MKKLIIVLFHPRTGSSLLMQTLKHLNVGVIGTFENSDLPQEANPKGYFEDRKILSEGINQETIERIENHESDVVAIKLTINEMIKSTRLIQWQYLLENDTTIFVTIRPPLETASSFFTLKSRKDKLAHFIHITTFLRKYCLQFNSLSKIIISKVPELVPNIFTVSYQMAVKKPEDYVQYILNKSELTVTAPHIKNAIKNIDPELYRFKHELFSINMKEWPEKIGANQVYNILLTDKTPWKAISTLEGSSEIG